MSSKIEVQRICQHCSNEFTARTTTTLYCSHRCNSAAYKAKLRADKIENSNKQTRQIKTISIDELKAKEFLTVREVASLLNCSVRSAYYYIENGTIQAVNLGQRITRIKRSNIDKLFEQPQTVVIQPEQKMFEISECYNLKEVHEKYGISETAIQNFIKRNNIQKMKSGKFVYVPKADVEKILGIPHTLFD